MLRVLFSNARNFIMKTSVVLLFTKYYLENRIKENGVDEACRTHGINDKCMKNSDHHFRALQRAKQNVMIWAGFFLLRGVFMEMLWCS
jgi:hypothetical protein